MSNKVSFMGIGETVATFVADGAIQEGQAVKLCGNGTVKACAAGERFFGVALGKDKGGCVAVQFQGLAQVKCADDTVTVGYAKLTADGVGGVKKVSTATGSTDQGQEYPVIADDGAGAIIIGL